MYLKWFFLQIKHNIRSFSFWLVVTILVITYYTCGYVEKGYSEAIDVLLCSEDSKNGDNIIESLQENATEGFVYSVVDSREAMEIAIIRGEATCGFVFTQELDEAIAKNDPDGEIIMLQASDSIDGYTVREIVYPAVLECSDSVILDRYLEKIDASDESKSAVLATYETILADKNLSIYDVINIEDEKGKTAIEKKSGSVTTIIMIVAILLMTIITITEEYSSNAGFFRAVKKKVARKLCMESALVNAVMMGVVWLIFHLIL